MISSAFIRKIDHAGSMIQSVDHIPTPSSLDELAYPPYQCPEMEQLDMDLLKYATNWGQPFGFMYEQRGTVVQNLFPIKTNATEQISSSSAVDLELHTETAFHSQRPDHLLLFCLRGDPKAGTVVSELSRFIGFLDNHTKDVLKQPVFETTLDLSFQDQFGADHRIDTSVLSEDEETITFDKALMTGKTPEAQRALILLTEAIHAARRILFLRPGEALIMDNKRTIHGRTSFKPRFDGRDRWFKRIMIRSTDETPRLSSFRVVTEPF